jgi:hypothetical protein
MTDSDDFARRAQERLRRATLRVFRSFQEENAASEAFWAALTPSERFAATCDMGLEFEAWAHGGTGQSGLPRSVERVQRP